LGKNIQVPNPGMIVAKSLADYLLRHHEIEKYLQKKGRVQYFVTDKNENFEAVAKKFLQKNAKIDKTFY
jgi:glutamate racemase